MPRVDPGESVMTILRHEIDRKIVSRFDETKREELRNAGYKTLRRSRSTVVMILEGDPYTEEELEAMRIESERARERWFEERERERERLEALKREARRERLSELTISNLWRHFCRKDGAYMNLKRNSFYFNTKDGKKVRVSDHESYHFQLESERAAFSRAADFDEPDFDFVITDFEFEGKTKDEVLGIIKNSIK